MTMKSTEVGGGRTENWLRFGVGWKWFIWVLSGTLRSVPVPRRLSFPAFSIIPRTLPCSVFLVPLQSSNFRFIRRLNSHRRDIATGILTLSPLDALPIPPSSHICPASSLLPRDLPYHTLLDPQVLRGSIKRFTKLSGGSHNPGWEIGKWCVALSMCAFLRAVGAVLLSQCHRGPKPFETSLAFSAAQSLLQQWSKDKRWQ